MPLKVFSAKATKDQRSRLDEGGVKWLADIISVYGIHEFFE